MKRRGTILLVDDEPFILSAVGDVLKGAGFEVHTCEMWAGVANLARRHHPDIVLLDYNMPMVKGDDICQILKRNGHSPDMRIILFSSEADPVLSRVASECGADGYIRKNTPGPVLVERLAGLLAGA